MSDFVNLISRILLSSVFIVYGYLKFMDVNTILNNPGTKKFMELVASGAAPPTWLGYLIAAIELVGGIAILIGFKVRWFAVLLALWLVVATAFGHPFWGMEGAARAGNQAHFYKNLAIIGGYLLLAIMGSGAFGIDRKRSAA